MTKLKYGGNIIDLLAYIRVMIAFDDGTPLKTMRSNAEEVIKAIDATVARLEKKP